MDNEMINPWTQVKSYHGHFEKSQTAFAVAFPSAIWTCIGSNGLFSFDQK